MLNYYDKLFADFENHKKSIGYLMLKIVWLIKVLKKFGIHRDAMKVHYVLLNKEYLTKQNKKFLHVLKIPVMFILSIPLSQHCLQYCLTKPIPARFPKCISKIRLSSHNLAVETGRFNRTTRNQRKCIYSNINCVEDEFHFILVCPLYDIFR